MIRILFRLSLAAEYHWHWTPPAEEFAVTTPPIDRRTFLRTAAAGATATVVSTAPAVAAVPTGTAKSCIFLMLTGGPSQLDTWDPKPAAPSTVRGPFAPIRTTVPGLHLSELFPKMAAMADQFSLIRTMHHEHAPIHETGFQLLNAGRRFANGVEWPSLGAVLTAGHPRNSRVRPWWVLPNDRLATGVDVGHGQDAGYLPDAADRHVMYSEPFEFARMAEVAFLAVYGMGARFVTVNAYPTVFDAVSWDCHADRGALRTTLADYRDQVAPTFDAAFTTLLTRLKDTGRLDDTLVVAVGEFGRTPKLNCHGGRDHWANCWTAVVAGGGVPGGRVVGESDATASEPKDRPVHCTELAATICHAMGVPPHTLVPGPAGVPVRIVDAEPVRELF